MATSATTLIVGEELPLVREALAEYCHNHFQLEVIARPADGSAAWAALETLRPDLALLDLSLPEFSVFEILRRCHQGAAHTRVIVMSVRRDRKSVLEALRCGAAGYVLKSGPAQQLQEAFTHALRGSVYVSPLLEIGKIFAGSQRRPVEDPIDNLSTREYQVFNLLVDGIRAKEIAARLDLSPKTVDTYRASLMRKLDIHDVAGLVKFAIQRDITSA